MYANKKPKDGELWKLPTTSNGQCAIKCYEDSGCTSFFYGPGKNKEHYCVGYSKGVNQNSTVTTEAFGWSFFRMDAANKKGDITFSQLKRWKMLSLCRLKIAVKMNLPRRTPLRFRGKKRPLDIILANPLSRKEPTNSSAEKQRGARCGEDHLTSARSVLERERSKCVNCGQPYNAAYDDCRTYKVAKESRDLVDDVADNKLTASSTWETPSGHTHGPERARLNTVKDSNGEGSWCAGSNDVNQFIQVEFDNVKRVTGIATKGRGQLLTRGNQWVTRYSVAHSTDGSNWYFVGNTKVFDGNTDRNSLVVNYLTTPINAKFVRINPVEWHVHVSMRFGVIGCDTVRIEIYKYVGQ
ncbi:hypothetical protein ScPMuIL_016758 [Solemya velum]